MWLTLIRESAVEKLSEQHVEKGEIVKLKNDADDGSNLADVRLDGWRPEEMCEEKMKMRTWKMEITLNRECRMQRSGPGQRARSDDNVPVNVAQYKLNNGIRRNGRLKCGKCELWAAAKLNTRLEVN